MEKKNGDSKYNTPFCKIDSLRTALYQRPGQAHDPSHPHDCMTSVEPQLAVLREKEPKKKEKKRSY